MTRVSWIVRVVVALALGTLVSGAGFVLRVDAGASQAYTDKAGQVWQPGRFLAAGQPYGFTGGETVDRGERAIAGTADPRIYQTEHWGMERFTAEVPNGAYTVRLHFAETYDDIAGDGPRVFDVTLQSAVVLKDLDVLKAAGAMNKALVKEFTGIAVTDGKLVVGFVQKSQNPEINAIEIVQE